jgi:hypothetical protein
MFKIKRGTNLKPYSLTQNIILYNFLNKDMLFDKLILTINYLKLL